MVVTYCGEDRQSKSRETTRPPIPKAPTRRPARDLPDSETVTATSNCTSLEYGPRLAIKSTRSKVLPRTEKV